MKKKWKISLAVAGVLILSGGGFLRSEEEPRGHCHRADRQCGTAGPVGDCLRLRRDQAAELRQHRRQRDGPAGGDRGQGRRPCAEGPAPGAPGIGAGGCRRSGAEGGPEFGPGGRGVCPSDGESRRRESADGPGYNRQIQVGPREGQAGLRPGRAVVEREAHRKAGVRPEEGGVRLRASRREGSPIPTGAGRRPARPVRLGAGEFREEGGAGPGGGAQGLRRSGQAPGHIAAWTGW